MPGAPQTPPPVPAPWPRGESFPLLLVTGNTSASLLVSLNPVYTSDTEPVLATSEIQTEYVPFLAGISTDTQTSLLIFHKMPQIVVRFGITSLKEKAKTGTL